MRSKHPDDKLIPPDLMTTFNEEHIELIWQYLNQRFSINLAKWKEFFAIRCNVSRSIPPCELFVRFGIEHLEPSLNKLLYRPAGHPTWISLIRYVISVNKKEVWEIHSKGNPKTKYRIIDPK